MKFGQSIKAIFSGLSVSFLTPNRTGEFLGRIIFIPKVNRIKASIITFICNYSQLLTTITIGLVSLFYLPNYFIQRVFRSDNANEYVFDAREKNLIMLE